MLYKNKDTLAVLKGTIEAMRLHSGNNTNYVSLIKYGVDYLFLPGTIKVLSLARYYIGSVSLDRYLHRLCVFGLALYRICVFGLVPYRLCVVGHVL